MKNWIDCKHLLEKHNAPETLIKHLEIVSSVSLNISNFFLNFGIPHNQDLVVCGSGIHDFGKILHLEELSNPGSKHEIDGKNFLLSIGVDPEIANFCVSHSSWSDKSTFEELLVSLSDKLWKGSRVNDLELLTIDFIAKYKKLDRWDVFQEVDTFFESVSDGASYRLSESNLNFKKFK